MNVAIVILIESTLSFIATENAGVNESLFKPDAHS